MMREALAIGCLACCAMCAAQEPLTDFWRRGQVRELLVGGIEGVTLADWAEIGTN